jgi:excisionase family DNA binding protein
MSKRGNVPEPQTPSNTPTKPPPPIKLLTMAEAAKVLRVPFRTLENWISSNRFPYLKSIKFGRHRLFLDEDLMEFVKARKEITAAIKLRKAQRTKKNNSSEEVP